jgi:hypothetical protein
MTHQSTDEWQNGPLNLRDALALTIQAGANVDGHWRQFYAYVFALLAWLSSSLSQLGQLEAWTITIATIGFFSINAIATIRAYLLLNLLLAETKAIASMTNFHSEDVHRSVTGLKFTIRLPMRIPLTALANVVAASAIIRLLWKSVPQ